MGESRLARQLVGERRQPPIRYPHRRETHRHRAIDLASPLERRKPVAVASMLEATKLYEHLAKLAELGQREGRSLQPAVKTIETGVFRGYELPRRERAETPSAFRPFLLAAGLFTPALFHLRAV
jgi:hypothetical protein